MSSVNHEKQGMLARFIGPGSDGTTGKAIKAFAVAVALGAMSNVMAADTAQADVTLSLDQQTTIESVEANPSEPSVRSSESIRTELDAINKVIGFVSAGNLPDSGSDVEPPKAPTPEFEERLQEMLDQIAPGHNGSFPEMAKLLGKLMTAGDGPAIEETLTGAAGSEDLLGGGGSDDLGAAAAADMAAIGSIQGKVAGLTAMMDSLKKTAAPEKVEAIQESVEDSLTAPSDATSIKLNDLTGHLAGSRSRLADAVAVYNRTMGIEDDLAKDASPEVGTSSDGYTQAQVDVVLEMLHSLSVLAEDRGDSEKLRKIVPAVERLIGLGDRLESGVVRPEDQDLFERIDKNVGADYEKTFGKRIYAVEEDDPTLANVAIQGASSHDTAKNPELILSVGQQAADMEEIAREAGDEMHAGAWKTLQVRLDALRATSDDMWTSSHAKEFAEISERVIKAVERHDRRVQMDRADQMWDAAARTTVREVLADRQDNFDEQASFGMK